MPAETQRVKYLRGREELICPCGVGHYLPWAATQVHGCCPEGCCDKPTWPGRLPLPGDLALCAHGTLGVVTSTEMVHVRYPDGNQAKAWSGLHLTKVANFMGQWSSRSPVVLPWNIWEVADMSRKGRAFSVPYLTFAGKLVDGWPARLEHVPMSDVRKILDWLQENGCALLASRKLVAAARAAVQ